MLEQPLSSAAKRKADDSASDEEAAWTTKVPRRARTTSLSSGSVAAQTSVHRVAYADGDVRLHITPSAAEQPLGGEASTRRRISVYWPSQQGWFAGYVKDYEAQTNAYRVAYDDGDVRLHDLTITRFNWLCEGHVERTGTPCSHIASQGEVLCPAHLGLSKAKACASKQAVVEADVGGEAAIAEQLHVTSSVVEDVDVGGEAAIAEQLHVTSSAAEQPAQPSASAQPSALQPEAAQPLLASSEPEQAQVVPLEAERPASPPPSASAEEAVGAPASKAQCEALTKKGQCKCDAAEGEVLCPTRLERQSEAKACASKEEGQEDVGGEAAIAEQLHVTSSAAEQPAQSL